MLYDLDMPTEPAPCSQVFLWYVGSMDDIWLKNS